MSTPVSDADGKPAAIIVTSLLKKVTPETCQDFIDETRPLLATRPPSRLAGARHNPKKPLQPQPEQA
ncbi:MAG: hypothetical protein ACLR0N_10670 [Bilophila wadsworthia]